MELRPFHDRCSANQMTGRNHPSSLRLSETSAASTARQRHNTGRILITLTVLAQNVLAGVFKNYSISRPIDISPL